MNTEIITTDGQALTARQLIQAELFQDWINYLDTSEKTAQTYTRAIKQFIIWISDRNITEPKRADIIAYRDYLKANYKATTVQGYMAAVKLFFKWTAQNGIYNNVAEHIKGAKIDEGHKKDYLTSSQASNLLNSIDRSTLKGLRNYALLALMITTGLRTISIIRANIEDIRAAGDATALYYQGKGKDERTAYVKLAAPVEKAIREYLAARGETTGAAPLFASEAHRNSGERLTTRSISRIVKDSLIAAGYNSDRLTAHSLRHTAATLNLLNGGTIEETRQLLGHSSINTTLIYSHILDRANNNSESRIAAAIL